MATGIEEPAQKTRKPGPAAPVTAESTREFYRLSVAQYHAMARAGILNCDDRVELLFGWLVTKMTKRQSHNISAGHVSDALIRVIPAGWYVAREEPLWASDDSEPEPDVMIVRGDRDDYPEDPPRGEHIALVVEVADSSLSRDKLDKKRVYAAAKIPVYWLVNLVERRIEVYTDPTGPGEWPDYRIRSDFGPETGVPVVLDGREIGRLNVGGLLPKAAV
jgi:Uma2 family endonuclease